MSKVILHQVPILLGGGRTYFQTSPEHIDLRLDRSGGRAGRDSPALRGEPLTFRR